MNQEELNKLIADTVFNSMKNNPDCFGSDLVSESLPLQITVFSTLKVLEQLGVLKLPNE